MIPDHGLDYPHGKRRKPPPGAHDALWTDVPRGSGPSTQAGRAVKPTGVGEAAPFTLNLSETAAVDRSLVGGKAFSLGRLISADFAVPEGFVVTTAAFRHFLACAGLEEATAALPIHAGETRPPPGQRLAALRARIVASALPPDLAAQLGIAYRQVFGPGDVPLAVRSSGVQEDLDGASYAGQYRTCLNVRGFEALCRAVKDCWASLWQPQAIEYMRRQGSAAGDPALALVVQRLIVPEVAGVLFTVNPVTGREEECVIEAVFGLGESLVSGRVDADRYVVDATEGSVKERVIAHKVTKLIAAEEGGLREIGLGEAAAGRSALSEPELGELAELGAAVQERYGRPMDIEWLRKDGRFHLVQARPITALRFASELGEWTTADFRDGGVSSDVCPPFMWSLYERAFDREMADYMERIRIRKDARDVKWCRMFFARPYWNLREAKKTLERLPGYRERDFDRDVGISPSYDGPGTTTPVTLKGLLRAIPILLALPLSYRRRIMKNRRYAAGFDRRMKRFDPDAAEISGLDGQSFAARYGDLLGFQFETEAGYFETIFNTTVAGLDFKAVFAKVEAAGGEPLDYGALLGGLLDISHIRPMMDLHDLLTRLRQSGRTLDQETVTAFARRWRHHGRKELDIRAPRWPEDLAFLRGLMEQARASYRPENDPRAQAKAQHSLYRATRDRALDAIGRNRVLRFRFLNALARLRRFAWWREEMRNYSTWLYALLRTWSLEAGRRLAQAGLLSDPEEIWTLSYADVLAALGGEVAHDVLRRKARAGRRLMESFRCFEIPNEIGQGSRFDGPLDSTTTPEVVLRGIPCSSGRTVGRARSIASLEEAGAVRDGDVLVTPFTDPSWTLLFPRLAGVVTETGGLLSHAAVISREYGIPAVLGVTGATRRIGDGDRIAVDGTQGVVEILQRCGA